jgi:hypothetical protein
VRSTIRVEYWGDADILGKLQTDGLRAQLREQKKKDERSRSPFFWMEAERLGMD